MAAQLVQVEQLDPDGVTRLLAAIVRGTTPSLPGAACVGRYALFDDVLGRQTHEQRRERFEAAVQLCEGCLRTRSGPHLPYLR